MVQVKTPDGLLSRTQRGFQTQLAKSKRLSIASTFSIVVVAFEIPCWQAINVSITLTRMEVCHYAADKISYTYIGAIIPTAYKAGLAEPKLV